MTIYGPHILAFTVFAICTSQILAHLLIIPPPVFVHPLLDLVTKCRSVNLGRAYPICGSDGNTYQNIEKLNCFNILTGAQTKIKSFGACEEVNKLPKLPPSPSACSCMKNIGRDVEIDRFCGSDGFTYHSQSEADCISSCYGYPITRIHDGACERNEECSCHAPEHIFYICGSDGQTYDNRESLACSNYCQKQRVQELFEGKCGGTVKAFPYKTGR